MTQHGVVIVEGYHDRAFLAGLLMARGWQDPRDRGEGLLSGVFAPNGKKVVGGDYGFTYRQGNKFLRLTPARGDSKVIPAATLIIDSPSRREPNGVDHIVLCWDADAGVDSKRQALLTLLRTKFDWSLEGEPPYNAPNGSLRIDLMFWSGSASAGIRADGLEGLVYDASLEAHPSRRNVIDGWLASRTDAPAAVPKNYMWSLMAGWHAERGCEDFLRQAIWQDAPVSAALLRRLNGTALDVGLTELERQ